MRDLVKIRPYCDGDRGVIRELCCAAAFGRERLESYGLDGELLADLMTTYYLRKEPGSAWVAEDSGRVVGYLVGSVDTKRQRRFTLLRVLPVAVLRYLFRGAVVRRSFWRSLRVNRDLLFRPPMREERALLRLYPAHLHIAVAECYRGVGVGGRLVVRFLEALEKLGVLGVHASVRSDNPGAGVFFERLAFRPVARFPALRRAEGTIHQSPERIVYGRAP